MPAVLIATIGSGSAAKPRRLRPEAGQVMMPWYRTATSAIAIPEGTMYILEPSVAGTPPRIRFAYRFFGGPAGEALVLDGLKAARKSSNTKSEDGTFEKAERRNHVIVPKKKLQRVDDIEGVARMLFVSVTNPS